MVIATVCERTSSERISCRSRRPRACAVSPLVPMRRKPNTQYTRLNTIDPTAMAPMYVALPMWPTMAVSTSPSSGTVMFVTMAGSAIFRICLSL